MKKTLVALAVLAASGASFAQATITGAFNTGYRSTTNAGGVNGADTSGLGIRDSYITFGASEDLGGGMQAAAQLKLDGVNRAGVGGGDAFLKLSSAMGYLKLGTEEQDTDLNNLASNVADSYLDNRLAGSYGATATLVGAASSYYNNSDLVHDYIQLGTTFGPVGVSLTHLEGSTGFTNGIGLATGATASKLQRENRINANYAAGALTLAADYAAFDNKNSAGVLWSSLDSRISLAGNYNLGVATVGAGVQNTKYSNGSAVETLVSVSVPVGATTLSAMWDSAKIDSAGLAAAADGTATGYGLAASYALSKRTAVRVRYYNYDAVVNPAGRTTETEVVLKHSF